MSIWNSPSRYVILLIGAIMVIYIPCMIIYMGKKKRGAAKFAEENPAASKVLIASAINGLLTVLSVNDEKPNTFFESNKKGFFLLPGENVIEAQYSWTRPGVMHKTVTTTVGPNKIKVTAEASKRYQISYDKKAEEYHFEEINK